VKARVLAQYPDRWLVASGDDEPILVTARGRLRDEDTPVTGDWVELDEAGAIAEVHERRTVLTRRAAGDDLRPQVLAANIDLALVTEPLPEPSLRRAERLVAVARSGGVTPALVLTKADLVPDADAQATAFARELGVVESLAVSAVDGSGLATLRTLLAPGETAVLLGASGAGKSTLANALLGEDRQATGAIRLDGRGRHTTVTRELLALPGGAALIDTPGLREAGLWDGGVDETFADLEELALQCRFADCQHETEPGCAVRAEADPERIAAWKKLVREQAWIDDRRAAQRDRESRGRSANRIMREGRHMKGNDGDD
jgi:ribosome biogenesis GTPase